MSIDGRCPDGGTCHHQCPPLLGDQSNLPVDQREHEPLPDACFRVLCCGPLSGVFPGDTWPDEVRAVNADIERTGNL